MTPVPAQTDCGIYLIKFGDGKFYIGSSKNIKVRLNEHRRLLRNKQHYNKHMQRVYDKYGIVSACGILDCEEEDLLFFEQVLMDGMLPEINGSCVAGKVDFTPELRARLSLAHTGKELSAETRAKISATLKGKKKPPEFGAKISATTKGVPKGPNKKLSEVMKGHKRCVGRKYSPETIAKMKASSKLRWSRPEEIERSRQSALQRHKKKG